MLKFVCYYIIFVTPFLSLERSSIFKIEIVIDKNKKNCR